MCPYMTDDGKYWCLKENIPCSFYIHTCSNKKVLIEGSKYCGLLHYEEGPKLPKLPEKSKQYTYKYFK